MTEIARELLEDVKIGEYVRVRYGTDKDQITAEGIVSKWSENFLYLEKKSGGVVKIRLDDNLRSLDTIASSNNISAENDKQKRTEQPDSSTGKPSTNKDQSFRVLREMTELPPAQSYEFRVNEQINGIRDAVKKLNNDLLKRTLGGIVDSFGAAVKGNEVPYKYHNLRAKILNAWDYCHIQKDYETLYYILGIVALVANDDEYALEPFVRSHKYTLAAYAAARINFTNSAQLFSLCALIDGEINEIDKYIAEIFVIWKDVETIREYLSKNKDNTAICDQVASCAAIMFNASGGRLLSDITPYHTSYDAAVQLLDAIPSDWRPVKSAVSFWEEYNSYIYPRHLYGEDIKKDLLTGSIMNYHPQHKYGFISPGHFFYIDQVKDDIEEGILLRKLLYVDLGKELEVSFSIGKSNTREGQSAATNIFLTQSGLKEAYGRISDKKNSLYDQVGTIAVYFREYENGRIESNGKIFYFSLDDIADPRLKAYYIHSFNPIEQNVKFLATGNRAKIIRWSNPRQEDIDKYWGIISKEDISKWEKLQASLYENKTESILLPEEDPYKSHSYYDLDSIDQESTYVQKTPLTWGGKAPFDSGFKKAMQEAPTEKRQVVKEVAPIPPFTGKRIITEKGMKYAEQARKEVLEGKLEHAAEHFDMALKEGFNEAIVCDYITLCIRQEGKSDVALKLLDQYRDMLQNEKALNLTIQVYERIKDYEQLYPLYEKAFKNATSVTKKSHNLFRAIDAYVKLGEYGRALDACNRWEVFFSQNKYSIDSIKLKNAEPNIQRQKAICYYHLNRIDEARTIATDLVRVNPTDEIANKILEGSLQEAGDTESQDELIEIDASSFFDDDNASDLSDSLMTRFVNNRIQQTDITTVLKSPHLKDGKYTGSTQEALEDVDKLVSGVSGQQYTFRNTFRTRSESLFAACKLLEQIEQRSDKETSYTYRRYRLAGKAMASWGDFMVSQLRQLDTTRMAYLFALRVLKPKRIRGHKVLDRDWVNSYNRYIKSFFLARTGNNSLEEYILQQSSSQERDNLNTDVFVENRIQDVLITDFVIGVLHLIEAISEQKERVSMFAKKLYEQNPELRISVVHQLRYYVNQDISDLINEQQFKNYLIVASNTLKSRIIELNNCLLEIGNLMMSEPLTEENISLLNKENWYRFLTATDTSRLNRIHYICRRSKDYDSSGDFDNRSDCLRAMLIEVKELLKSIQDEPTDVSYDIYLPFLEQMSLKLADKQLTLYQDFLPRLSFREVIQPFRTLEGQIQIQLIVENENNYQSADSLTIHSVVGPEVVSLKRGASIQTLRGGEEDEVSLIVEIDSNANRNGSFTAVIGFSYKCSDSPQNIIIKNQEMEFTFVIRNEYFEPFRNPFIVYEGKVMDDDSMFFGRSEQMKKILNMICPYDTKKMNYGRAIAMYGQTRTGKSSLLFHIKKELENKYNDQVLIWDMGNVGEMPPDENFILQFICSLLDIANEAIYQNELFNELFERNGIRVPIDEIKRAPLYCSQLFSAYMRKISTILKENNKIIVLIIDEFSYFHEYISNSVIPAAFMRFWKALLQKYSIFTIVTGQDDMPEFMREYPNEFACMELMKLTYLEERDTKMLIRNPLINANKKDLFNDNDPVDEIYKLTAGSAYLTIILCSNLVSYLNTKGAYTITMGILKDFLNNVVFGPNTFLTEVHFESQLNERGHAELNQINRLILLSIARVSQTTGYAQIDTIECEGYDTNDIQIYVDRLVDRNVLVREGRNKYWIQVKLLELWLINTKGV